MLYTTESVVLRPPPRQQSACHLVGYSAAMVAVRIAVAADLSRERARLPSDLQFRKQLD
jgi:hypothetical protein